ncbi:MAG TPA: molybdopterin-dependent oxidoreductase, partial [Tepidisphaeraceae bacterium]
NIWLHHNEGVAYRIKPRYNPEINKWWINDDTRLSYQIIHDEKRLFGALRTQYGTQVEAPYFEAITTADAELRKFHTEGGDGSIYGVLSPMMASEEAYLLGKYLRSIDPQATLVLGPVPRAAADDVFTHYISKAETFRIQAEKVPNKNGILRVLELLGGPSQTWDEFSAAPNAKLKAGWIVGGYHSNWTGPEVPAALKKSFKIVQDFLPSVLTAAADVLLPSATWAEKSGSWENYANVGQAFEAAFPPRQGAMVEGEVYAHLLGRKRYDPVLVREEMGEPFAAIKLIVATEADEPAMEFVEI